ncbi:hypothetical protein ACHAXR_012760 [Thalassiosira sp. AJA248-18]
MNESDGSQRLSTAPLTIRVAVGSTNPCKIEAVRKAFEDIFVRSKDERPVQIVISSHSVPSGVSDQPFGDIETRKGAMNRAKAAYDAATCSDSGNNQPDFAVGLEGGLDTTTAGQNGQNMPPKDELWCMAWMAILGSNSNSCITAKAEGDNFSSEGKMAGESKSCWGYAKTGSFLLPPAICELVMNDNMELGHADDKVFKRVNSKHGSGTVGVLTDGEIDRAEYYVHALKLAMIPWIRPELYLCR